MNQAPHTLLYPLVSNGHRVLNNAKYMPIVNYAETARPCVLFHINSKSNNTCILFCHRKYPSKLKKRETNIFQFKTFTNFSYERWTLGTLFNLPLHSFPTSHLPFSQLSISNILFWKSIFSQRHIPTLYKAPIFPYLSYSIYPYNCPSLRIGPNRFRCENQVKC